MIVRPDGGDPKNLTTGAAASYDSLRWSADSSSIIATANVDGGSAVVRISVDTGVIEQLWAGESWLLQLSMSLNGRFAALVSIPETHTEVHSGTLSGDDLPSIRSQAVTRSFPEWILGRRSEFAGRRLIAGKSAGMSRFRRPVRREIRAVLTQRSR
jgi:hypothetical protein